MNECRKILGFIFDLGCKKQHTEILGANGESHRFQFSCLCDMLTKCISKTNSFPLNFFFYSNHKFGLAGLPENGEKFPKFRQRFFLI